MTSLNLKWFHHINVSSQGQTVLLDTDTAVLKMLVIDGGKLIFDNMDVTLNAENILITNGGLLQVFDQ